MFGLPDPIYKKDTIMNVIEVLNQKKRIIKEIMIMVSISVLTGFVYNCISEQQIPLIYHPNIIENDKILSLSEIKIIYKNKEALFIDTRIVEEFEAGHIPDAVNIPSGLERSKKIELLNQIPRDLQIIVYCENPQCNMAERLAKEMQYLKFTSVAVFEGGWDEWNSKINSEAEDKNGP